MKIFILALLVLTGCEIKTSEANTAPSTLVVTQRIWDVGDTFRVVHDDVNKVTCYWATSPGSSVFCFKDLPKEK